MKTQTEIKQAIERFEDVIRKRPTAGQFSSTTTARLTSGLACEIEEGPWKFICDEPESLGGEDTGPDPGVYGRAAIAACVTIGIAINFARKGLQLGDVRVDVESEGDMSERTHPLTPYRAIRLRVDVETTAPEAEAKRAIDASIQDSTWRGNARTALDVPAEAAINGKRVISL
jgi:uncharacterized OsmC-like protein